MKFDVEYRTPDNVIHRVSVCAANRDAAFSYLKTQGIRPSRIVESPGFFNKVFGKGKRWIVIGVLGLACIMLVFWGFRVKDAASERMAEARNAVSFLDSPLRRQLVGDTAVIEKGISDGWADVFEYEGERFLAGFAVPGTPVAVRNTTEDEIRAALTRQEEVPFDAGMEARQICAIVGGMKTELRRFLENGGTIVEYGKLLVERQEKEIGYYNQAKSEIEQLRSHGGSREDVEALWMRRNADLRAMGIKLVQMPE